ncbi:MAG TPA: hypothetical protein VF282_05315 [Bacillota bacterium]
MASATAAGRGTALRTIARQDFEREVLQAEGPVLVDLHRHGEEYPHVIRGIQEVLRENGENLPFMRIEVEAYQDMLDEYRQAKGYHAYNLDKFPAVALFRAGRLVTTFNPTLSSQERGLQYLDAKRQFQRFLDKFVHYDPEALTFNHKQ